MEEPSPLSFDRNMVGQQTNQMLVLVLFFPSPHELQLSWKSVWCSYSPYLVFVLIRTISAWVPSRCVLPRQEWRTRQEVGAVWLSYTPLLLLLSYTNSVLHCHQPQKVSVVSIRPSNTASKIITRIYKGLSHKLLPNFHIFQSSEFWTSYLMQLNLFSWFWFFSVKW